MGKTQCMTTYWLTKLSFTNKLAFQVCSYSPQYNMVYISYSSHLCVLTPNICIYIPIVNITWHLHRTHAHGATDHESNPLALITPHWLGRAWASPTLVKFSLDRHFMSINNKNVKPYYKFLCNMKVLHSIHIWLLYRQCHGSMWQSFTEWPFTITKHLMTNDGVTKILLHKFPDYWQVARKKHHVDSARER